MAKGTPNVLKRKPQSRTKISCVLCEGRGHVAKLCPNTKTGAARLRVLQMVAPHELTLAGAVTSNVCALKGGSDGGP